MAAKAKKRAPRKNSGAAKSKQVLAKLDRAHLIEMTRNLADIVTITGEEQPVDADLRRHEAAHRRW